MMSKASTLRQFQKTVWDALPIRKNAIGQEVVDDVLLLAIQMWPAAELSAVDPESEEEDQLLAILLTDLRRMMVALYGIEEYQAYSIVGLNTLTPHMIAMLLDWWRARKANKAKLTGWRRNWIDEQLD